MRAAIAKRPSFFNAHCGDQGGWWENEGMTILCIADGLGHGQDAETASRAALDYVAGHLSEPLPALFAGCDKAISPTRGAAVGIAVIDHGAATLTYAGVGNTRAIVVGSQTVRLGSQPGILGTGYRRLSPENLSLAPGDLVIMVTDGVKARFDFSDFPRARGSDVSQLARQILKEWGREADDAAVLVYRNGE